MLRTGGHLSWDRFRRSPPLRTVPEATLFENGSGDRLLRGRLLNRPSLRASPDATLSRKLDKSGTGQERTQNRSGAYPGRARDGFGAVRAEEASMILCATPRLRRRLRVLSKTVSSNAYSARNRRPGSKRMRKISAPHRCSGIDLEPIPKLSRRVLSARETDDLGQKRDEKSLRHADAQASI